MRKAPAPTKIQGAFQNHTEQADSTKPACFLSIDNPLHLRGIHALGASQSTCKAIDTHAGCSDATELVAELSRWNNKCLQGGAAC